MLFAYAGSRETQNKANAKMVQQTACKEALSQKIVTYLLLIGPILFSIFMNLQIRGVVCHQSEEFADGVRCEALPSSRLKGFQEEISKRFGKLSHSTPVLVNG